MSTLPGDCRNHWAQRQAEKAGIGFTPMDNAFAAVSDVPALQAICDSLGEEHIRALLAKWLRILPYPFGRVNPNWDLGSGIWPVSRDGYSPGVGGRFAACVVVCLILAVIGVVR